MEAAAEPVEAGASTPSTLAGQTARELPGRPATVADALPMLPGVVRGQDGGLQISAAYEHRAALIVVVGWSLAVINGRAARFFVPLLLPPEAAPGTAVDPHAAAGYSLKLGPVSGRVEPDRPAAVETADNVGAVVGVLERLLVVILILGRAEIGIGLVVAAKTLARFKQLDERSFAEKYLVGTLASVTVAVASALAARVVLGS